MEELEAFSGGKTPKPGSERAMISREAQSVTRVLTDVPTVIRLACGIGAQAGALCRTYRTGPGCAGGVIRRYLCPPGQT